MTNHSVNPPAADWWTVTANDGQGGIAVANSFYTDQPGWSCVGARVYFSYELCQNLTELNVFAQPTADNGLTIKGGDVFNGNWTIYESKVAAKPSNDLGWVEIMWGAPIAMEPNVPLWLGYQNGGGWYQYHAMGASSGINYQAADGSSLWLGNSAPTGDFSEFQYFRGDPQIDTPSTGVAAWGIDIIAQSPDGGIVGVYNNAEHDLKFWLQDGTVLREVSLHGK